MEIGTEYSYKTRREQIKWIHSGQKTTWDAIAYNPTQFINKKLDSDSVTKEEEYRGFCAYPNYDEARQNKRPLSDIEGNNGIINGYFTYDKDNRKASIEFQRAFDVNSDMSLTL